MRAAELMGPAARIIALHYAGHDVEHIAEIGRFQHTWTRDDVARVLRSKGVTVPDPPRPARVATVTPPQFEVLRGVCDGWSEQSIARRMGVRVGDVRGHVAAVLAALDARDTAEAVVLVLRSRVTVRVDPGGVDR